MKPSELSPTFRENLKVIREHRDLSQRKLADLLGTSQNAVSHWESGINSPTLKTVEKIAEVLEVNIEALLTPNGIESFLSAVA